MGLESPDALYVHVPFCVGKCGYCDFYSVVVSDDAVRAYLDAVAAELRMTADVLGGCAKTVYVGGGTPTSLDADELDELLRAVLAHVDAKRIEEFTVEANPGTLSREKLLVLESRGVNRLSLGAQSFNDRLLAVLGRRHRRDDVGRAVELAREAGLANLSLDLIFGVPTGTVAEWRSDLDEALSLDVPHVSAYSLTYEEGTPLARAVEEGAYRRLGEEDDLRMYEETIETLTSAGFEHYEVSNFARRGFACRHNEIYWANESYLGVGPAAVSYIGGERRRSVASVPQYAERLSRGELPVDFRERLKPEQRARETAVMNLRRTRGMDLDEFRRHTGFDAMEMFGKELQSLAADGLVEMTPDSVRLTRKGLFVADSVLAMLV
jgi:oxygen-independent coproporphyrinogen-3 oxidase